MLHEKPYTRSFVGPPNVCYSIGSLWKRGLIIGYRVGSDGPYTTTRPDRDLLVPANIGLTLTFSRRLDIITACTLQPEEFTVCEL